MPPPSATDEAVLLRERLTNAQSEAYSLRLDLAEAEALIRALEDELWSVTTRWREANRANAAAGALTLIISARTQVRRTLLNAQRLRRVRTDGSGSASTGDLRIAEAAFGFLLRLRSLCTHG